MPDAISFNAVPSAIRVPGAYGEVDGSRAAGAQAAPVKVLLIGYRLAAGAVAAGIIKRIGSEADAETYFGTNSQIAQMARAFKRLNVAAEVEAIAVDENGAGTAAAGTITLTGTATKDGTVTARVGDVRASIAVASGTAAAAIATALAAALNALPRSAFTAGAATTVVTATARHKGTSYNGTTLAVETLPAGVTAVVVDPTGGATDPDLSTTLAAVPEAAYDTLVSGIADAANLARLETEIERRWSPTVLQPALLFAGIAGAHADTVTFGSARNSKNSSIMGTSTSPTPPWVWAAQVAARDAQRVDSLNPNRPRRSMTLPDCEAPPASDRYDWGERNTLLYKGVSTFTVDRSGMVAIEKLITTYQTNPAGVLDAAYLAVETVRNLAGILKEWLSIASKYDTALLGNDEDSYSAGVPVVTPLSWKGEIAAHYATLVFRGRCKDAEGFTASMLAGINGADTARLDFEGQPRLVQGLNVIAFKLAFRL
jgi:phage tail sheath gpL-like